MKRQLRDLFELLENDNIVLDGEIFVNGMSLQDISGIVRSENEKHPDEDKLHYIIFDVINEQTYYDRMDILLQINKIAIEYSLDMIQVAPIYVAKSRKDIDLYFNKLIKMGYEGIVVRNYDA